MRRKLPIRTILDVFDSNSKRLLNGSNRGVVYIFSITSGRYEKSKYNFVTGISFFFSFRVLSNPCKSALSGRQPQQFYSNLRSANPEIFKGAWKLNQSGRIQVYGSRQRSLLVKAHTTTFQSLCGVTLANDKVYLITGRIWKGNLQLNLCN